MPDHLEEVMVILRRFAASLVAEVPLEFLVQVVLHVRSHLAKLLSAMDTSNTAVLHDTVFATTDAHRTLITG